MTEDAGGLAPRVPTLDELLLEAKLSVPPRRPGTVSRAALIETARSSDCRVVGVTAPAGYGKSTLLAEWAGGEDRPVAWVTLDRFDDDPAVLLAVLASAYAGVAPGNDDLVADMDGLGVSVLGRAAPRLATALVDGEVVEGTTKTSKTRTVRLDRRTVAALKSWKKDQAQERIAAGPGWSGGLPGQTGYL